MGAPAMRKSFSPLTAGSLAVLSVLAVFLVVQDTQIIERQSATAVTELIVGNNSEEAELFDESNNSETVSKGHASVDTASISWHVEADEAMSDAEKEALIESAVTLSSMKNEVKPLIPEMSGVGSGRASGADGRRAPKPLKHLLRVLKSRKEESKKAFNNWKHKVSAARERSSKAAKRL